MNKSKPISNTVEFVNITPVNNLISKCVVKVLYTGRNRNGSFFSKEVASKMANSLPGTPIVGKFLEEIQDFTDHTNDEMIVGEGGVRFKKQTVPYGFVSMDAKPFWQEFQDEDGITREYLCVDCYVWSGRYPECNEIVNSGKGQSMEIDPKSMDGIWAKLENDTYEHFIVSDANFYALCILGDGVEPCFEGASIKSSEFSLMVDTMKTNVLEFCADLNKALQGGENLDNDSNKGVEPIIPAVEPENTTGFAKKDDDEDKDKKPFPPKKEGEDDKDKDPEKEDNDDEDKKKKKYTLEEVAEYTELLAKYEALVSEKNSLESEFAKLIKENEGLKAFQIAKLNEEKDELINVTFAMVDAKLKEDIVANKESYSLEEIESKLSVIAFRNKVNFNLEDTSENESNTGTPITTFNATGASFEDNSVPAWIKALDARN